MPTDESTKYYSFLIRLWVVGQNDHRVWRASLEDPKTGEILGFESLPTLCEYLETLTSEKEDEE